MRADNPSTGGRQPLATADRTAHPRASASTRAERAPPAFWPVLLVAIRSKLESPAPRALRGRQIPRRAKAGLETQRAERVDRREREVEHAPLPADLARRGDLHEIVPEQATNLGGHVGVAIVEPVRTGVEVKRVMRERARVAADRAGLEDARGQAMATA